LEFTLQRKENPPRENSSISICDPRDGHWLRQLFGKKGKKSSSRKDRLSSKRGKERGSSTRKEWWYQKKEGAELRKVRQMKQWGLGVLVQKKKIVGEGRTRTRTMG